MLMRDEGKDLRAAEKLLNHTLRNEPFLKHQAGLFSILLFELADTHLMLGDLDGVELTLRGAMTYRRNDQDARTLGVHDRIRARMIMARNQPGDLATARDLFKRAIEVTSFRYMGSFRVWRGRRPFSTAPRSTREIPALSLRQQDAARYSSSTRTVLMLQNSRMPNIETSLP